MSTRRVALVLGGLAAAGGIAAALWGRDGAAPEQAATAPGEVAKVSPAKPPADDRRETPPVPAAEAQAKARRSAERVAEIARAKVPEAGQPAVVKADEVLARVNGKPITGRHLLPFTASQDEQTVSPAMYAFLLGRAIDREVTLQEAQRLGIELSAEQRLKLEERAAFDAQDMEYLLLLNQLADRAGVPSPFPNEADVETYYRAHPAEFEALPEDPVARAAAWQAIQLSIREKLSNERQTAHKAGVEALLANLKASAEISAD